MSEKEYPSDVRFANVFLEPKLDPDNVEQSLLKAYKKVKEEISKVLFKYELSMDSWKLLYAIRVDAKRNNCKAGGAACVMIQIPYRYIHKEIAINAIISYVTEIMELIDQEYSIIYIDSHSYALRCNFDNKTHELITSEVKEYTDTRVISCVIKDDLKSSAYYLQNTMDDYGATDKNKMQVPMYLYIYGDNIYAKQCIMIASNHGNHGNYNNPMHMFEVGVLEELEKCLLPYYDLLK